MGAFKNEKNGTWYVQFRYTDWQGLRQQKLKRGFATKREAHYEISIDDLANGISREKKSEQAENLIRDCLSNGKYPQQIILKKAQNTGISKRVLDEAKKSLGIISIKDGCQWYWKLPEEKEARNF